MRSTWRPHPIFALIGVLATALVQAQDRTVLFDTSTDGVTRSIENWGLDATWSSYDNVRRGAIFMGADEVDMVRVAFLVATALVDGELTAAQRAELDNMASLASMELVGPSTLSCDNAKWWPRCRRSINLLGCPNRALMVHSAPR